MSNLEYSLLAQDGRARHGTLATAHGVVETPAFMPVGTAGVVKSLTPQDVQQCGAEILLSNTYHLYLRPGHELIRELGGLHEFMRWPGPILTDSGGFQVFSLSSLRDINDDGVTFRSHIDGSSHLLTPEKSMEIQSALGSDIAMVLDECPALPSDRAAIEQAVDRTTLWARRSLDAYAGPGAAFGIVQGGTFEDLRRESAERTASLPFDGLAVGGVSVGESREEISRVVAATAPWLPADRPRYLMGMGTPDDLLEMVGHGIDLFDCVMPTRNARNGTLFVRGGRLNLRNSAYREDDRPLEADCPCPACRDHSRAFLRHLLVSNEIYGHRLNTLHNLTHYLRLMEGIRTAIKAGTLESFRQDYRAVPPGE